MFVVFLISLPFTSHKWMEWPGPARPPVHQNPWTAIPEVLWPGQFGSLQWQLILDGETFVSNSFVYHIGLFGQYWHN